ncbi:MULTISPECIES: class I SAM-dependent methyltransferase [unclassified Streptomyces]|uniref:class I SAM-dependent methyltransferase n=1 Tax=unclassified Streptomyces TaxID=2593676 RepID=UPI00073D0E51|nr:class I SAM-dependent methyltransferase [Streptomyces sp. AVP053U2]ODA70811.1 Magnesium-protoporphyrin O-methyltransferase [Streptomyces sp. AVP053U2]
MTDATATTAPDPDPDHIAATRAFYDAVAEDYTDRFRDVFAAQPVELALLAGFAGLVEAASGTGTSTGTGLSGTSGTGGRVADLGCGPGWVTAHLASCGLDVFGLDLSESMLRVARRENPGLRFEQGSMLDPGIPDGTLDGVVSWYSSIHVPQDDLPALFAGFRRLLVPGGHLLLAFQAGEKTLRVERPFGHPVVLDFQRRRPDRMADALERAGFTLVLRSERAADEEQGESTPQAFLIARRPRTDHSVPSTTDHGTTGHRTTGHSTAGHSTAPRS